MRKHETQISLPWAEIKLDEIDVNMICFGDEPSLPRTVDNYDWDMSLSVSTDRGEDIDEPFDQLTCYINADLMMKGHEGFLIKVNTLHTYQVSKLKYKKAHVELFKSIALEAVEHANELLTEKVKGTVYEGFALPQPDEDFLEEDAQEWNRHGYIARPVDKEPNGFGRKLKKGEIEELTERAAVLVKFIDDYDDKDGEHTQEETAVYYSKYAEWIKLNKQIWHYKLIARNYIAYTLTKMMERLEKGLQRTPDNYELRETYESLKESYDAFMTELKDEFAKN